MTPNTHRPTACIVGARYRLERDGDRCTILSRTLAGWNREGTFDYDDGTWTVMAGLVANDGLLMDHFLIAVVAIWAALGGAVLVMGRKRRSK